MKLVLGLFGLILFAVAGCATISETPTQNEPLFATWVAKELIGSVLTCKFIDQPDGKSLDWTSGQLPDQPNNYEGRFTILKKWHDSKGNTWYNVAVRGCIVPYMEEKALKEYALIEVHADGKVLEGEWSTTDFPPEFGALGNYHFVYHRED